MLKRLSLMFLMCLSVVGLARADNPAVVTQVDPGGVSVNFGQQQQAQNGQEFYIYHNGQWVGRIRLTQVGDNSSVAQVVQTVPGTSVEVGDVISSYAPTQPAAAAAPPVQAYSGVPFPDLVRRQTRSFFFGGGMPGTPSAFHTSPNYALYAMGAAPLFMGSGLGSMTPFYVGSTALTVMNSQNANRQIQEGQRSSQSQMMVIQWDANLLQAYAGAYVADNETDPVRQAQLRQNLLVQKGVDKNYIFQVQITNKGFNPLTVGSFNQHFFLLDSNGNRLAARRYDPSLDQSIPPGGDAQGFVYFDRFDAYGSPRVTGPVKVVIDNVQGSGTTMSW